MRHLLSIFKFNAETKRREKVMETRALEEVCLRCRAQAGEPCKERNETFHCVNENCDQIYETAEAALNCTDHVKLKQDSHA